MYAANYGGDNSEPGYESLPDQSLSLSNDVVPSSRNIHSTGSTVPRNIDNDPGYETVEQSHEKAPTKEDGSDYDPNYETLRPTITTTSSPTKFDNIDSYAKVINKTKLNTNDGYSSIKMVKNKIINNEDDDNAVGYCTISDDRHTTNIEHGNHDYASIRETTKEQIKYDEDVYSSIPHEMNNKLPINNSNNNNNNQQLNITIASTPSPSSITLSPNTAMSTSICSAVSDTSKTLTSPSSESDSSTPIRYSNIKSADRSQLTVSVSNYESLTGSDDSDSNYESVRYLNAKDRENPYEQLYNESDIKYDTLKRDDHSGSITGLYSSMPMTNAESKNSSLSSSSGGRTSRSDGKISSTSSSLNNNSDAAG